MKQLSLRRISLALLASTTLCMPTVLADDFVVDSATVVTNVSVNGNDTLEVTATGSINPPLGNDGVFATGSANIINNAGSISTTGAGRGIDAFVGNTITNSGSIATDGNQGFGIKGTDGNTIDNSGSITTKDQNSHGIFVDDKNTISNSGTISTEEDSSHGILVDGEKNNVSNSGTITTSGESSAIWGNGDNNTVSNSGSIVANGGFSPAINMQGNENAISNSGSILTTGFANTAIKASGANNVVTNSGSIATTNAFSSGIFASGAKSVVTNSGTISTTGNNSSGIGVNEDMKVTNSGIITTTGDDAYAIFGVDGNTFTNSGTLSTAGFFTHGIEANDGNTITNSGTIKTSGNAAFGIHVNGGGSIQNTGTILGSGESARGISADTAVLVINNSGTISMTGGSASGAVLISGNEMTNSGSISVAGDLGAAVLLSDNNIFENTGIIYASGASSFGIQTFGDNIVTNSGKVISVQSYAFSLESSGDELNLLAPSFIGGEIEMGIGSNKLNITTGASHSNLWKIDGVLDPTDVSLSGPVPWAWDAEGGTQVFATLDPTALSAASGVLADNVGLLSELARTNNLPGEWWLKGYGNFGQTNASGVNNDYTHLNGGIAAGASFVLDAHFDLGAFVGYQVSDLKVASRWVTSQTISGSGLVGGIYGTYAADSFFADFALYGGFLGNSSNRFVNDNLAPLGVAHALADYNSFFLAPEVRVGVNIETDGDWTLTPSASARFSNQWVDGYTETGSNANATFGARMVQVFEGELELAATRDLDVGELTVRGGVDYRQSLGGATLDVVLLEQTLAMPVGNSGTFGAYVGADFNYNITDQMTLDLSAKGSYGASGYAVSGSIGISGLF